MDDIREVEAKDQHGRGILTVRQLLEMLEGLDPDTHVVLEDGDGWYDNISKVGLPFLEEEREGEGYDCVSFFKGVEFDARQF